MAVEAQSAALARGFNRSAIRWPLVRATDVVELRYGKALPEKARRAGQVPVYGTNGQCGCHDEPLFKGPGVVLGRKGMGPLGVEWSPRDYWVIDTAYSAEPLRDDFDLRFFYYLISYVGLNHLKDGTSNPSLSRSTFGSQLVPWPPLSQQRAIAHSLATLDDKIDLNRRMAQTLEEIARTMFRSWFVDFDPVREITTVPDDVRRLFPDRLVDSSIGPAPEGWIVGSFGAEFGVTMGQSPPGSTYNQARLGLPFFQGKTDFGFRFPMPRVYCSAPIRTAQEGDVLLTVRAPVGDLNVADQQCCIGRGVASVRHPLSSSYGYYLVRSLKRAFDVFDSEGTVYGSVSKRDLEGVPVLIPPAELIQAFDSVVRPMDELALALHRETKTLAELRDTLLPKLMSGEIHFANAP